MDINKSMELSLYCFKILLPEVNGNFSSISILHRDSKVGNLPCVNEKDKTELWIKNVFLFSSEKG